jgi:hypothetical protein
MTSETDEQFVARMEKLLALVVCAELMTKPEYDRLFALARRGAALQTHGQDAKPSEETTRAKLVERVKRLFYDYYDDHIESAGDAAAAAIDLIRAETLEEAAGYCDTHTMGVGYRKSENKFGAYIAEPFNPSYGSRHEGNGYAAAIRALMQATPFAAPAQEKHDE